MGITALIVHFKTRVREHYRDNVDNCVTMSDPNGGRREFREQGQSDKGRGIGGERSGKSSASGGHGSRRERDCLKYKLLGECDGKDTGECRFSHKNRVQR